VRNGVETRYIYDAGGNLLAEADASNNITKYFIHGLGLMAMVTPTGDVYTYHFNAVGSTIAMTDSTQAMVNKYSYDPFGNILNQQETVSQPFKFIGQHGVMTEPNGFYYMRARYYDPSVGRFISEDPIGFDGGDVNLCAYAGNQPINRIDPLGLIDLFGYVEGDLVGILGIEGGVGFVVDTDDLLESGVFTTIGPAAGANVGASLGAGFALREIEGWSTNIDVNAFGVSPVISFDDAGFNGAAVGLGPGKGMSISETYTSTYTIRDAIQDIKDLYNNFVGWCGQ
jgi:RHS repeat-associated protein